MNDIKGIIAVGIDVSKEKLDVAFLLTEGEFKHLVIPNTDVGIKKVLDHLTGYKGKIILESTGRYHLLCTLTLSEAELDVRVLNPLMSHKHLQGGIRKNKTDKIDAIKLAQMAFLEHDLPERFNQDKSSVVIRQKIGLIASLEKQIQTLRGIEKGYQESQRKLDLEVSTAEGQISLAIKALNKAKGKLEKEIEELICANQGESTDHEQLISIPGVSSYGASLMLQFFDTHSPKLCQSPKQWIAYAGLDITVKQSGKWNGKGKLSKRGNAYLRKRLFTMAWGAVMNYDAFKKMYYQLKEKGVHHTEALLRITRKIICIAFTLLKKGEYFNEQKCFFV